MALAQRVQNQETSKYELLLARLLNEWRSPQEGNAEPIIIEEAPSAGARANHLYVVWSEWAALTPIERSKAILQAYEAYRGRDLSQSVTLAMGLTPQEASNMGLQV